MGKIILKEALRRKKYEPQKKSIKEKASVSNQLEIVDVGVEVAYVLIDKDAKSATWMHE
jgi:hypothetical protein